MGDNIRDGIWPMVVGDMWGAIGGIDEGGDGVGFQGAIRSLQCVARLPGTCSICSNPPT